MAASWISRKKTSHVWDVHKEEPPRRRVSKTLPGQDSETADANCVRHVTKPWNAPTSGAARLSVCDDASTSVSEDNTLVHFLLLARPAKHHRETSPLIHLEDKNILTQVSLG